MQDKFPIIVYGEDGTHITNLLLDFLDKFGSQLIEDMAAFLYKILN